MNYEDIVSSVSPPGERSRREKGMYIHFCLNSVMYLQDNFCTITTTYKTPPNKHILHFIRPIFDFLHIFEQLCTIRSRTHFLPHINNISPEIDSLFPRIPAYQYRSTSIKCPDMEPLLFPLSISSIIFGCH